MGHANVEPLEQPLQQPLVADKDTGHQRTDLQLTVESSLQSCLRQESRVIRTWTVCLRVTLGGQPVALDSHVSSMRLTCPIPDVSVVCQGLLHDSVVVYKVTQADVYGEADVPLKVLIAPKYHSATGQLYRLESPLCELVGRQYLQQPKYALTLLLHYARAKDLVRSKAILCDAALRAVLGCSWVSLKSLWKTLSASIRPVDEDTMSAGHCLSSSSSCSQSTLQVTLDKEGNMLPRDWVGTVSSTVYRAHTMPDVVERKKSSLRRHKSI